MTSGIETCPTVGTPVVAVAPLGTWREREWPAWVSGSLGVALLNFTPHPVPTSVTSFIAKT